MHLLSVLTLVTLCVTLARGAEDVTASSTQSTTPSILSSSTPSTTTSLLLKRLEESQKYDEPEPTDVPTPQVSEKPPKPEMYSLKVTSRIEYRFANTLITSRLANPANTSQEIFFSVVLPETAFISKFLMEVGGKVYEAYVKEKKEAKQEYDQAVAAGLGAAHIALSARDSNRFTVSVNIEPLAKVTFNLTYEELLTRRLGAYNHVINLDPGQIVRELTVDVFIKEARNITTLRVPELRSGNEIDANELTKANSLARIQRTSTTEAHISFSPTPEQQKALGKVRGQDHDDEEEGHGKDEEGLGGQFVVQYDVNRDPQAGEVLVNNGFFVHFFAPEDLPPLRKHALFVLDVSGSMEGRKIEQLKEAMDAILDDLNEGDFFNIIEFSYSVTVWNLDNTAASAVFSPYSNYQYDGPAPNPGPTPAFPATPEYVAKAKEIVKKMRAGGGTNIYDTLKTVIRVAHHGLENITITDTNNTNENNTSTNTNNTNIEMSGEARRPIIVFLTDGEPTVGETRLAKIFSVVDELNDNPEAAIFSLAFGDDADLGFLKKLSLKNSGFARKIYEASDAALQLRDFYRQIASPLLANVTFNYVPDKIVPEATTKASFHTLFSGSELVVAGKLRANPKTTAYFDSVEGEITGIASTGESTIPLPHLIDVILKPPTSPKEVTSLERLWAYLTIKQLLEKDEARKDEEGDVKGTEDNINGTISPKKEALELALKYSFVTPLTSLVVVKPNATKASGSETVDPVDGDTNQNHAAFSGSFGPVDRLGASGYPLPLAGAAPPSSFFASQSGSPGPVGGFGGSPVGGFGASSAGFSGGGMVPQSFQQRLPITPPSRPSNLPPPKQDPYPISAPYYPPPPLRPSYQQVYTTTYRPGGLAATSIMTMVEKETFESPESVEEESDSFAEMTTVRETFSLISLDALSWLNKVQNGSDVTLPFGANKTDVVFQLLQPSDELNTTHTPKVCYSESGFVGTCQHLRNCTLNVFQNDILVYGKYFCSINNYAGACCPDEILLPPSTLADVGTQSTTGVNSVTQSTTGVNSVTQSTTGVNSVTQSTTGEDTVTQSNNGIHSVKHSSATGDNSVTQSTVLTDVITQVTTADEVIKPSPSGKLESAYAVAVSQSTTSVNAVTKSTNVSEDITQSSTTSETSTQSTQALMP